MADLVLTGLDGANPLGFLATLGVLAAIEEQEEARLRWEHHGGWRPVLISTHESIDTVVVRLDEDRLSCLGDSALTLSYEGKRDLKPPPDVYREYLLHVLSTASMTNRRSIDWAGAFATDTAVDNNGMTKPTALHFTAGNQMFLKMVLELGNEVTLLDLREAVGGPWTYSRALPVMGWDSTSSRDYALRASNPATDKKNGVPGADWLAVRGLTYLPVMQRETRVYTTGCVGGWKDGRFRWPLWAVGLTSPVIRSLLGQDTGGMPAAERRARAIAAVFSSGIKRSDQGGYGSLEPAEPL